jgi:hypothetical protein
MKVKIHRELYKLWKSAQKEDRDTAKRLKYKFYPVSYWEWVQQQASEYFWS